jgi:hypothetical protein
MHLSIFSFDKYRGSFFILSIIAMVYIIDTSCYWGLSRMFKKIRTGQSGGKVNHILYDLQKPDILVMGSSKASHHVNTNLISNAYNLGHDGARIGMSYAILEVLVTNGKAPRLILLHTDPGEYFRSNKNISSIANNVGMMSSYYNQSKFVQESISDNFGRAVSFKLFKCSAYREKVFSIAKNYWIAKSRNISEDKGFEPLKIDVSAENRFKTHLKNINLVDSLISPVYQDKEAIGILQKFGKLCTDNNITMVCFSSPEFIPDVKWNDEFGTLLNDLNLKWLNYASLGAKAQSLTDISVWKDNAHLNRIGAEIFTRILIQDLRNQKFHVNVNKESNISWGL